MVRRESVHGVQHVAAQGDVSGGRPSRHRECEVRIATSAEQVAEKARQSGRGEDKEQAICEGLLERQADHASIDEVYPIAYYDDTSGKKRNEAEMMKARREEFAEFEQMDVYANVPHLQAIDATDEKRSA